MEIRRIDGTAPVVVEHTSHDDRERSQKRHQPRKKDKVPSGLVYKPNGKLEEEPPPKIDVLV
jgi:hypothetical protein